MQNEIWKDIPEYEKLYQASNLGNIKSLISNIILKPNNDGYNRLYVVLYKNKSKSSKKVHQLVAMAFLNHKPCGFNLVVDHIDNYPFNNKVENLQLISLRENSSKDKKGYSSKYVGVTWHKRDEKWTSSILIDGKRKYLGYFDKEIDAHNAYKNQLESLKTRKLLHGR